MEYKYDSKNKFRIFKTYTTIAIADNIFGLKSGKSGKSLKKFQKYVHVCAFIDNKC